VRLATLIISIVLMLVAGIQSCAVAAGGSITEDLSTAAKEASSNNVGGVGWVM